MKFNVDFYKYDKGSYIQTELKDFTKELNKKELMIIADLRHPVLTKGEYFENSLTDIDNKLKQKFTLLSNTHYLVVTNLSV